MKKAIEQLKLKTTIIYIVVTNFLFRFKVIKRYHTSIKHSDDANT